MVGLVFLAVALASTASFAAAEKTVNGDIHAANMGFFTNNMMCNDDGTMCMDCFSAKKYGRNYLYAVEINKDPGIFHVSVSIAAQDWDFSIQQSDLSDNMRFCTAFKTTYDEELKSKWKGEICMSNDFSEMTSSDCPQPLLIVAVKSYLGNAQVRGQRVLYCQPPAE